MQLNDLQQLTRTFPLGKAANPTWTRLAIGNVYNTGPYSRLSIIVAFLDGATRQVGFGWDSSDLNATVRAYCNTTPLGAGGTWPAGGPLSCFEIYLDVDPQSGTLQVWQDGTPIFTYTGSLCPSGAKQITAVAIGTNVISLWGAGYNHGAGGWFDDFAVNDTTGTRNNSRIGQGGIFPLYVTGDVEKAWVPSAGSDNYKMVNSRTPDADGTYVQASSVGARDLYTMEDLSGTGRIDVFGILGQARAFGGGGAQLVPGLLINSTTDLGSAVTLTNTYAPFTRVWEQNPATGDVWDSTAINSLLIGLTVG